MISFLTDGRFCVQRFARRRQLCPTESSPWIYSGLPETFHGKVLAVRSVTQAKKKKQINEAHIFRVVLSGTIRWAKFTTKLPLELAHLNVPHDIDALGYVSTFVSALS